MLNQFFTQTTARELEERTYGIACCYEAAKTRK